MMVVGTRQSLRPCLLLSRCLPSWHLCLLLAPGRARRLEPRLAHLSLPCFRHPSSPLHLAPCLGGHHQPLLQSVGPAGHPVQPGKAECQSFLPFNPLHLQGPHPKWWVVVSVQPPPPADGGSVQTPPLELTQLILKKKHA